MPLSFGKGSFETIQLRQKTALVTGAGSGIGRELCRQLIARGARVTGTHTVASALAALRREVPTVTTHVLDVTNPAAFADVAAGVWNEAPIDLLVNNAGIAVGGEVQKLSLDDWRRVFDVNVYGVVHGIHAVYPLMVERGQGMVCNIASLAGLVPAPFLTPYAASKHAVVGLTLSLRAEAARHGVRVSVACPGAIDTPIWARSKMMGALSKSMAGMRKGSVTSCATTILDGIVRDEATILVGREAHLLSRLYRVTPRATELLTALSTRRGSRAARPQRET